MSIRQRLHATEATIHEVLQALENSSYRQRRQFLRDRINPRYSRFLYKYRALDAESELSVARLRDILVDSKLWLSSPVDFNDPFDMTAHIVAEGAIQKKIGKMKALLKKHRPALKWKAFQVELKKLISWPNAEWQRIAKAVHDKHLGSTGVCSLANDPRSILMWSHYAANHTGVCVQFEIAHDPRTFLHAISVDYAKEYPVVNCFDDTEEQLKKTILRKHEGWYYEGEHRIVRPSQARSALEFKPEGTSGIILGCRVSKASRDAVKRLLEERAEKGWPTVRVFCAEQHSTKYALTLKAA